mmetsp:Transcript_18903/g.60401  ORF Transcript_18903/g.60401 Transcript_18903/m.60401 type:complete len:295 (+) Transcript_18903:164-1048(+)
MFAADVSLPCTMLSAVAAARPGACALLMQLQMNSMPRWFSVCRNSGKRPFSISRNTKVCAHAKSSGVALWLATATSMSRRILCGKHTSYEASGLRYSAQIALARFCTSSLDGLELRMPSTRLAFHDTFCRLSTSDQNKMDSGTWRSDAKAKKSLSVASCWKMWCSEMVGGARELSMGDLASSLLPALDSVTRRPPMVPVPRELAILPRSEVKLAMVLTPRTPSLMKNLTRYSSSSARQKARGICTRGERDSPMLRRTRSSADMLAGPDNPRTIELCSRSTAAFVRFATLSFDSI